MYRHIDTINPENAREMLIRLLTIGRRTDRTKSVISGETAYLTLKAPYSKSYLCKLFHIGRKTIDRFIDNGKITRYSRKALLPLITLFCNTKFDDKLIIKLRRD